MLNFVFIFKSEGCDHEKHNAIIETPSCKTTVFGAETIEETCEIAKKVVREGCHLIELCGDYGPELAKQVIQAIDGAVPVGYVDFLPEERAKLEFLPA